MAEASEEGQGPRRAVEPMMRMMMTGGNNQRDVSISALYSGILGLKSRPGDRIS
jgi:hypothetical protein